MPLVPSLPILPADGSSASFVGTFVGTTLAVGRQDPALPTDVGTSRRSAPSPSGHESETTAHLSPMGGWSNALRTAATRVRS